MSKHEDINSSDSDIEDKPKGLNVELHPVLQSGNIKLTKSLYNTTKTTHNEHSTKANPYLSTSNRKPQKRRLIHINDFDEKNVSVKQKLEKSKTVEQDEVDIMDSWDTCFYNKDMSVRSKFLQNYNNIGIEDDSDGDDEEEEFNDENDDEEEIELPSVRFIQHPNPYKPEMDNIQKITKFNTDLLTKQERMKLRRQERKKKRMEMYQKIQNGEITKVESKISLKKINNVLMNDKTIEDPTKFEINVKTQIEQRRKEHEEANKKRQLEAIEKRKQEKQENNSTHIGNNYHCKIFQIHNLSSPKIRFQINTTAKQLKLYGLSVRLRTDIQSGRGIIILISQNLTNLNKFERKIIKFNNTGEDEVKNFKINKKWEGPIIFDNQNIVFVTKKIWFMREFSNETDILNELDKKGLSKYWKY